MGCCGTNKNVVSTPKQIKTNSLGVVKPNANTIVISIK
jgi:hypothetical protein